MRNFQHHAKSNNCFFHRVFHLTFGGHVAAYLKTTGEKRWEKYLYQLAVNPKLKRDERFVLERRIGSPLDVTNFLKKPDGSSVYYGNDDRVEPIPGGFCAPAG